MKQIPLYKAEKELGLAEQILAKSSVAYISPAFAEKAPVKELALSLSAIKNRATAVNKDQIDLFYLKDILVSTGWNLNDDVFTRQQTWSARNTAEDKQFNLGHNQKEIIGHMTSQYAIDCNGEALASDLTIDDLPDKFHIVSSSVIYRFWPDADYMKKINQIVAEIEEQTDDKAKWFVSMEALFDDFDYALMDSKGKQTIIPRTEASAFLTKHLRTYGGKGVYNDYKVGRVLKNIVFSGKGLVENPANPESVIFNDTTPFKASASEINSEILQGLGYANSSNINPKEIDSMANENEVNDLKAALAAAKAEKADLEKKLTEEANKAVQAKVDELTKTTEAAKAKAVEVEASLKAKDAELVEANKKLSEVNDKLAKANEVIKKAEDEKRALARKASLLGLGHNEEVATNLAETLSVLSDEAFAKYVEKSPKVTPVVATEDDKKKSEEEAKKTEAAKAEAAKKALDNAEPNREAGSASVVATADMEATRRKIADTYAASKGKAKNVEESKK